MLKQFQKALMLIAILIMGGANYASAAGYTIDFTDASAINSLWGLSPATAASREACNFEGKKFQGISFSGQPVGSGTLYPLFFNNGGTFINHVKNSQITFTAPEGSNFKSIVFNYISASYTPSAGCLEPTTGSAEISGTTATWSTTSNDVNEVGFTVLSTSRNVGRISSITFTFAGEGGGNNDTPTPTTYSVTISNTIANGTVTADKTSGLSENDVVTLTATPASGYEFSAWDVKTGSTPITVTNNQFSMPAGNVTVSASFVKSAPTTYPGKDGVYSDKVNEYVLDFSEYTLGIDATTTTLSSAADAANNIAGHSFQGIKFGGSTTPGGASNYPCLRTNSSVVQLQISRANTFIVTAPDNCWIKSIAFEYTSATYNKLAVADGSIGSMTNDYSAWNAPAETTPSQVTFTTEGTYPVRITKMTFTIIGDNGEEETITAKTPSSYDITNAENYGNAPGYVGRLAQTIFATVPAGAVLAAPANVIKLMTPQGYNITCTGASVNGTELSIQFGGLEEEYIQNGDYTVTIPAETFRHEDSEYIYTNNVFVAKWTVVKTVTSTIAAKYGVGTFYSEVAMTMPANTEAYVGTYDEVEGSLKLTQIEGTVVPAQTAVVIKGQGGEFAYSPAPGALPQDVENHLRGTAEAISDLDAVKPNMTDKILVLGVDEEDKVGFYNYEGVLGANKAYMVVTPNAASKVRMIFPDETTGISSVENNAKTVNSYYNLQGQRVNAQAKGIVIVNGKKMFNK